ncbi:MAG TPA: undecaprenyl-diphosphatase UppP [Thermodesulfobacteriota bacterium]|nr:undecaprenyl-diphosphatase UppP [Thermodesulfobacteriota bacterium]
MVSLVQSIILGIVQGITEFLPISSTAHLALFPWFLKWNDPGLAFDVALHIGTLTAVIYYFWREWVMMVREFVKGVSNRNFSSSPNVRLGLLIVVATIPGALFGFQLEEQASGILRHPILIALSVFVFAIILFLSDRFSNKQKQISDMNLLDCLIIGFAQALAIIPGVSRSGATITGALIMNFKRDEAARFSFLLSTPLIVGAIIFESRHLNYADITSLPFIAGILTSALFGFLSIKYLLRYLQTKSYTVFVVYRIVLAALIVFIFMQRAGS